VRAFSEGQLDPEVKLSILLSDELSSFFLHACVILFLEFFRCASQVRARVKNESRVNHESALLHEKKKITIE